MHTQRTARIRARVCCAIVAVGFLTAAACGGGDSPSGASSVNLTGTWDATYTFTGFSVGSAITLTQSGNNLTGTYVVSGGFPTGQVTGTVSGNNVTFHFAQDPPCLGTFNGSGTLSNNARRITGSYTGSDCSGSLSPTFVANKR